MDFFKKIFLSSLLLGLSTQTIAAVSPPLPSTVTIAGTLSITAGGVSQTLFATNQYRADCFVQNLEATDIVTISFKTAGASTTTIGLGYLDTFNCTNVVVVTDQINIFGPTTGDKYIAYEVNQGAGKP